MSEVKAFCKADLITALQKLNVNRHQQHAELREAKGGKFFQCALTLGFETHNSVGK